MNPVMITIDTTHPLNEADRAVLRALLDGAPTTASHAPAPAQRQNSAESIMSAIANSARKPDSAIAAARLPVASQPGVSFTESTPEEDPHAG